MPATEPPTAAVDTGRVALVVTAVATVAVDVVTKIWASAVLADGGINLPGPLDLQLAHNRGVAFSLFGGAPAPVMIGLTSAVTVVLAVAAWRGMFPTVPAGVILGGAVANLADRMVGGSVVDMLHAGWWPTFNLADAFITTGVALLVLNSLRKPEDQT